MGEKEMTYIEKIQSTMNEKQVSLRELARRTGIEPATICRIFSGKISDPKLSQVIKMALALDLDYLKLFEDIEFASEQ